MLVRRARIDDALTVAAVWVASWQAAYAGLLDESYLASLAADEREPLWRKRIEEAEGDAARAVLVGEVDGRLVGLATVGPSEDADTGPAVGELTTLYLHPEVWGQGVGRALHDAALDQLSRSGYRSAQVWMLGTNARAGTFYRRQGWRPDGVTRQQVVGGVLCDDVRLARTLPVSR